MLDDLRARNISDLAVLHAMSLLPRENFVPPAFRSRAYTDHALPIAAGQTISQPYTVACMTALLEVEPGMKVLEVGTGSGYQAAVLCMMGAKVYTIERHSELLQLARANLASVDCNVATHLGDGSIGWSSYAPYDRIIVTAGAPVIPTALTNQLAPNGRMIIPTGGRDRQRMEVVVRVGETNEFDVYDYGEFKFVPLIGRSGWKPQEE